MPNVQLYITLSIFCLFLSACAGQSSSTPPAAATPPPLTLPLADPHASQPTQALYYNLQQLSGHHLLFGHQDSLAYGHDWWADEDRSDIKDISGSHAAVVGWELGGLELGHDVNIDKVNFQQMQGWIKTAFRAGAVNTLSWHMSNPVTGESAWSKDGQIKAMLPGGSAHEKFKAFLDRFVSFNQALVDIDSNGQPVSIPIIFRPWHEHSGDWFWWGKGNTREADYIALWQFTVHYLRDVRGVHNLIYAYAPDRGRIDLQNFDEGYFWGYPGDEYIDIIGLDDYSDLGRDESLPLSEQHRRLVKSLENIARIAAEKNKIAALTEGGYEGIPSARYWTQRLQPAFSATQLTRQVVYAMVWRNANAQREQREHFFGPFAGHPSAADFLNFVNSDFVMLANELPALYQHPH